ncbi:bifunctional 2-polyprenyl-6-hydroxyphenol methylase/3-demethylubiquinol 3-O-methyltransferase UbiG [Cesiribacter sp. SM1]|uniref:class I SAM-dependent methyltransferase n=1 Tax=Cesiribacter sp. SM1 TaxID=2861196 RepID=UPI001CD305C2|nr:methyltransferase domain-containing protein [Cesiribacter sp. SM1]
MVSSPLTGKPALLLEEVPTIEIAQKYKKELDLDVNYIFQGHKTLQRYLCRETGYSFFYPFDLAGDGKFYSKLQQFDWYYMPWKWEHNFALSMIRNGMKILEIGCGTGGFINKISSLRDVEVVGLELNEEAVAAARTSGANVLNNTVQEFSVNHAETFDVVCSFQVLEHISDVDSFIRSSVECLKKGGKLIVSVPNNDSFIKYADYPLNLPPHHMGHWTYNSLKNVAPLYNLEFENAVFEPLQHYHIDWYLHVMMNDKARFSFFFKMLSKFRLNKAFSLLHKRADFNIKGHSITAVYTKS